MEKDIIQITNLKKYYGEVKAVDGISFNVERGTLFSLLGINGAGKSTTIGMLCTLYEPTEGEVTVCGHRLGSEDRKIRNKIGVVWQQSVLDGKLTIKENLKTAGALFGLKGKELTKKIDEIAAELEIEELLERKYEKLSGGQKRRCEIASAIIHTPELLILDEPTTGLDPATRKLVWKKIEAMQKKTGMTVFLTTHYMEEAAKSDKIVMLNAGKIVAEGTPSELKSRYSAGTIDDVFLTVLQNEWENG